MSNKSVRLCVGISSLCPLLSLSASAGSVLYTHGPVNGNTDGWTAGSANIVSDSFGLGSASTINNISFGDWVSSGDTPATITWSISSLKLGGGTVFASGTSSLTNTLFCLSGTTCGKGRYDVYTSLFSTNVALGAGTYYLNFSGSTTATGDNVLWDENDGVGCSGVGCPSTAYENILGTSIGSEAFSLNVPSIPEPSTVLDIFGSGAFATLGLMFNGRLRQKLFRR